MKKRDRNYIGNTVLIKHELYRYSYKKVKAEKSTQHVCVYPKNNPFIVFGRFNY